MHPDEFADADIGHTQSDDGEAKVGSTRLDRETLGSEAEAPRPQESPSAVKQHAQRKSNKKNKAQRKRAQDAVAAAAARHADEASAGAQTDKSKKTMAQWKRAQEAVAAAAARQADEASAELAMSLRARVHGRTSQIAALQVRIDAAKAKDAFERLTYFAEYAEARQRVGDARGALGENEGAEETTTEAHGLHHICSEH